MRDFIINGGKSINDKENEKLKKIYKMLAEEEAK